MPLQLQAQEFLHVWEKYMTLKDFYIKYSLWAAILFTLWLAIFLFFRNYTNMWLLYIGNILFCAVVYIGVIRANHRVHDSASLGSMFMVGIKITVYALLIAVVLSLVLLGLNSLMAGFSAKDSPAQSGSDTATDVIFTILSHTIGGNAFLGVLASVIASTVAKRNQKTEQGKTMY